MTVGIAAIAERGQRIVLMTDRQLTGEYRIEEETAKQVWLANGWNAAYSGDRDFAYETIQRANVRLGAARQRVGSWDAVDVGNEVHEALIEQWVHAVSRDVLRPMFLDTHTYRSSDDKTRGEAEAEIERYREDRACELLLCGFTSGMGGRIVRVALDGHSEEHHFACIGSGRTAAAARLTWQRTDRKDPLRRVVYEVYTAKAHAEMDAFVGKEVDAIVLVKNWNYGDATDESNSMRPLSDRFKELLDQVFRFYDQTPLRKARRAREVESSPHRPPANWEALMDEFLAGVLPGR